MRWPQGAAGSGAEAPGEQIVVDGEPALLLLGIRGLDGQEAVDERGLGPLPSGARLPSPGSGRPVRPTLLRRSRCRWAVRLPAAAEASGGLELRCGP